MATLCCLMIFTSCAKTTRNVNNDEQVVSKELSTKDATGKDIPEWVKGSLGEGTLFEKVDIDGIGGADDEVYIITAQLMSLTYICCSDIANMRAFLALRLIFPHILQMYLRQEKRQVHWTTFPQSKGAIRFLMLQQAHHN